MTNINKPFLKNLLFFLVIILTPVISIKSPDQGFTSEASAETVYTTHLPFLSRKSPPQPPTFGTQVSPLEKIDKVSDLMESSGIFWVRLTAFNWKEIEPIRTNPSTYDWSKVAASQFENLSSRGMRVIATIIHSPDWAHKEPGVDCGPISADAFDEYAQFLQEIVKKYGKPPYNIKYWELGNEPDIDPGLVRLDSEYGCWGDKDDDFYGGEYYAEMLKVAYPAIKAVDPSAQVLIGGLLLDCDPTNPPAGMDCKPAKFLEGVFRNGGGNFFDVVNFHGYPLYSYDLGGGLYYDEHHWGWESRGGVVLGKINFLREVMANYGIKKPIILSEGSLICPDCESQTDEFLEAQADYVVWLYVRNIAEGVKATIWYIFNGPGWRFGGMLDAYQEPKPAYWALDFMTTELAGTYYQSPVVRYPTLRGYEFSNPQKRIWVLWSPDGNPQTINLPSSVHKVLDKYGNDITPSTSSLTVKSPIYVELNR